MGEYTKEDIGCYFDGAFGYDHNALRVLDLAKQHGFNEWSSRLEQQAYSPNGVKEEHYEEWMETIDRAEDYLNEHTTRPDNTYWSWEDGDFGLWQYDEDGELTCEMRE
tara:strand:+ start:236 stop:559 length:324 start_codon:yes stop_codon:yes gene_type:complete